MTPEERELLTTFLQQMAQARAEQKDPEAEALIRDAAARQPDALYLLTQRALGLDYALHATQAQVAKLQTELDQLRDQPRQPAPARQSFIGDPNAWGRSTPSAAPAAGSSPNPDLAPLAPLGSNTLQRNAAQAPQPAQAMRPAAPASSWGGAGILGTVAATAAGVAGGALLYQGISSMMNHNKAEPTAAAPPPEPAQVASNTIAQEESFDSSDDYAGSGGGDFDSGDAA
ncbi:MAG: DUF2076 domain-containing protein [Betaproteobacteria bacterium]|nr:DUF2076 domain-containing protein [Betaproteobacteria bacterium]